MNTNVNNTNKDELTSLCDKINGLIINYIQTKSLDNKLYKENYTYFLNSPICKDLLSQIKILKDDLYHKNGDEQNISMEINNPDNRLNCSDWLTGLDYSDNDDTTSDHFSIYKNNTKDENEENVAKADSSVSDSDDEKNATKTDSNRENEVMHMDGMGEGYFGQRQSSIQMHGSVIEYAEDAEEEDVEEEDVEDVEEEDVEEEDAEETDLQSIVVENANAMEEPEEASVEEEPVPEEQEEEEESVPEEQEEEQEEEEESVPEEQEEEEESVPEEASEEEESVPEEASEEEESVPEEASEEEESEEEEDIYEVMIVNKNYYTNNEKNGDIYEILPDEDIGNIIGRFINGKAIWN